MAKPVQDIYLAATKRINQQNSYYARKGYGTDHLLSVHRVAAALGVADDEIVLTRNATAAIHNLIRQYRGLKKGESVLYADIDYPSFKNTMAWLQKSRGVTAAQLALPSRATQQSLLSLYINAFDKYPNIKLMLVTHVSNQHGMVLPLKAIAAEARKRGIDLISDNAQSWGLIDYQLTDFDIDWAGFNLHKWIGAPVGVGALYIKRGSLHKIAPYPGESDPENTRASTRVHTATANFAAIVSIPAALDFHEKITGKNKEARLRYLRSLWTDEAEAFENIELLGGIDEASKTGMASFRLRGKNSIADATSLQQKIEKEFGIFTVIRKGLASGACVRITPQVFNTPAHMEQLVSALAKL
jgi:selenocysteine lyase/cysteine desulfurase